MPTPPEKFDPNAPLPEGIGRRDELGRFVTDERRALRGPDGEPLPEEGIVPGVPLVPEEDVTDEATLDGDRVAFEAERERMAERMARGLRREQVGDLMRDDVDEGIGIPLEAAADEIPRGEIGPEGNRLRPHWVLAVAMMLGMMAVAYAVQWMALWSAGQNPDALPRWWAWMIAVGVGAVAGPVWTWFAWPRDHYAKPESRVALGVVIGIALAMTVMLLIGVIGRITTGVW